MTLYREEIIERYRYPRHRGVLDHPHGQGEAVNSFCGDDIVIFLKLDPEKKQVREARFSGEGCALMQASADILCEYAVGKTLEILQNFQAEELLLLYGEPPTPSRIKCVLLPYEALKMALRTI